MNHLLNSVSEHASLIKGVTRNSTIFRKWGNGIVPHKQNPSQRLSSFSTQLENQRFLWSRTISFNHRTAKVCRPFAGSRLFSSTCSFKNGIHTVKYIFGFKDGFRLFIDAKYLKGKYIGFSCSFHDSLHYIAYYSGKLGDDVEFSQEHPFKTMDNDLKGNIFYFLQEFSIILEKGKEYKYEIFKCCVTTQVESKVQR